MTNGRLLRKEIWIEEGSMYTWQHQFNSRKYLEAVLRRKGFEIFEVQNQLGYRRTFFKKIFPFSIECRLSESEPVVEDLPGLRIVLWDKERGDESCNKLESQSGWMQAKNIFSQNAPPYAFLDLQKKTIDDYYKEFDATSKRYRNKWQRMEVSGEVKIREVGKEEYLQFYKTGLLKNSLKKFFIQKTENFDAVYGEDLRYLLAQDSSGKVLGGLSFLYEKSTNQSLHFTAFLTPAGDRTPAGVGLVDYWIKDCLGKKIPFATLGIVWEKGQDDSWKGYGNFKLHFRPIIIYYRNTYLKFTFKI
jgi:hypothetical protein